MNPSLSPQANLEQQAKYIIDSYARLLHKPLIPLDPSLPVKQQLDAAPIVVLSHGIEEDPILNYGNQAALNLWEMDFQTFTSIPSKYTAEPMERQVRERFLLQVAAQGYVDEYTGIRIASSGRRFWIQSAVVWNLSTPIGERIGQAAAFEKFEYC